MTGDWTVTPRDIWHDRAVFHFLTEAEDRAAYVAHLKASLKLAGSAVLAAFGPDGPEKCSGLPVRRYTAADLGHELGPEFALVDATREMHRTPSGAVQSFVYALFRRIGED